jgi:Ca-activated chloride channel family protein
VTTLKRYVLAFLLLFGISLQADVLSFMKNENRVAFDKGVKLYKAGEYEKALSFFSQVKSSKEDIKAIVYFNIANSQVRLKEFKKARTNYEKSLILSYSKEADESLEYIKNVKEQKDMSTGQQKSAKKSSLAKRRENSEKKDKKKAGGSNMKVTASANSGSNDKGKKSQQSAKIDLNANKTKLSSKQYELINKRQINEAKPW